MLFGRKICEHCFIPGCTSISNRTLPDPSQVSPFTLSKKKFQKPKAQKNVQIMRLNLKLVRFVVLYCIVCVKSDKK